MAEDTKLPCEEDVGYENPHPVICPCKGCDGTLKSDGRNRNNNLTFLMCDKCLHTYCAYDYTK